MIQVFSYFIKARFSKLNGRNLILIYILLLATMARAQNESIYKLVDSLKIQIPHSSDSIKFKLIYKIAYELFDVDNKEAVIYADHAHQLSWKLGDSLKITRSGRLLGQLLRRVDQPDEAIAHFNQVLPIAERNDYLDEEKRILNALAVSYNLKAMYANALNYNFKSLEIREREGNKKEISIAQNNIGVVYYKMGDFKQALEYYNRALKALKQVDGETALDELLINISLTYIHLNEYEKAKEFVDKGFAACGDKCSDIVKMEGEHCLGNSLYKLQKIDLAETHFNKSYEIAREINDKRFQADNLIILSEIELIKENFDQAIKDLSIVESISKEAGYKQILMDTYFIFSKVYNKTRDLDKASLYQSKYLKLKDSVYSEELIINLATIQNSFVEKENLKTADGESEVLKLKEQVIFKTRSQYFFILAITLLCSMLTFTVIRISAKKYQK